MWGGNAGRQPLLPLLNASLPVPLLAIAGNCDMQFTPSAVGTLAFLVFLAGVGNWRQAWAGRRAGAGAACIARDSAPLARACALPRRRPYTLTTYCARWLGGASGGAARTLTN